MSTTVSVHSYTHSVSYVTDQMLRSLKTIIKLIGLDPTKLTDDWDVLERGISTWLRSQHLRSLRLEIYHSRTDKFVGGWDFHIDYGYGTDEGEMWADVDQIRATIIKCGAYPSSCEYRIIADNHDGRPDVQGWSGTSYRSTEGFVFQSVGTTIGSHAIGAQAGYWRKQ